MDPSAFSLLAAPLAMPAAGGPDPSKLISFFAQEMQLFFAHIQGAVVHYNETGQLPHSLFSQKAVRTLERQAEGKGEKRKDRIKRKPTAFNLFVKEKLEEFKAKGVKDPSAGTEGGTGTNNGLFRMAVAEWGKLSEAEKADYHAKYAPIIAAMAAADGGDAEAEADGEGEDGEGELEAGGFVESLTAAAAESPKKKKKSKAAA